MALDRLLHDFGDVKLKEDLTADFKSTESIKDKDITLFCHCLSKKYNPATRILTIIWENDIVGSKQTVVQVKEEMIILKANII
jgi:hypothetical protein